MKKAALLVFGLSCLTHLALAVQNDTSLLTSHDLSSSACQYGSAPGECEGRTFGIGKVAARRRMVMFFLPVMFKLGVIMTLLVVLTVMVSKGLGIGLTLLYFALSNKEKHGGWHHRAKDEAAVPVHVHLHNPAANQHYSSSAPSSYDQEPYWERFAEAAGSYGANPYMTRGGSSAGYPHYTRPR